MASKKLKLVLERIAEQGIMSFNEGATKKQIKEFEKEAGLVLPAKYKEWLLLSDGGYFFIPAGVQMYGVAHKPCIDVKDDDRPNESYAAIGVLSTGDPILYKKGSEQISIYNHEAGAIENDEQYEDFYAFLEGLYELLGIGE